MQYVSKVRESGILEKISKSAEPHIKGVFNHKTAKRTQNSPKVLIKVRPHHVAQHTATQRGKATQQKSHHVANICGCCVGSAAACRSMLRGLKIRSANCRPIKRSRAAYDE